ncbi:MAG: WD40 repeat domain-containing protein [bacterium]
MNVVDGKVVPTRAYDYLGAPRLAIFDSGQAFVPSWAPGIRLLYADRPVEYIQSPGTVFDVRMSNDYRTAVLFSREGVWLWPQDEEPVRLDWSGPVTVGDFDGRDRVVVVSGDEIVILGRDGAVQRTFAAPARATAIAWRKGHDELLVGRLDGGIELLDLSGKTLAEMTQHEGQISTLETSPDGAYLAAASWDATVSISKLDQPLRATSAANP